MTPLPQLVPPLTKGHFSVARLARYWYVVCRSESLRRKPLAVTLLGVPLVVFRTKAGVAALLDRCPHRNVPLSAGRLQGDSSLQCAYHGWRFGGDGRCLEVPGLMGEHSSSWRVPCYRAQERHGLVWVYATADAEPDSEPFDVGDPPARSYATVVREVEVESTLHAAIENALDVPHTAFLHRGLFRGGKKHRITAIVSRYPDRVVIEYEGEPRPPGAVARILSPSGGIVEHWDRFFLPAIAQVEYRLGDENHFLITSLCTPVSDTLTKMFAVATFKTRLPARWLKHLIEPFAMRIFQQDARILKRQTETVKRFGGEQFVSTDLDLMGPQVWRLMKQAESGALAKDPEPSVKRVQFWA